MIQFLRHQQLLRLQLLASSSNHMIEAKGIAGNR
jgi:hypothetical protein